MEATEILEKARAGGEPPKGWIVLPLLRNKVRLGILGWIAGAIIGFGLFVVMVPLMIPHNYQYGFIPALISTVILGMVLFVGIGSVWQIIVDTRRLLEADKHIIVITPDEFVMQDGEDIRHVPLMYIRNVTARGIVPPDQTVPKGAVVSNMPHVGENLSGFLFGRGFIPTISRWRARRRAKNTPSTLAFIDSRTNTEVIIRDYNLYGDPTKIASLMQDLTSSVQRI
ncbi:MAG: hypothetical protein ACXWPG_10465 [Ktedonobacteraceae bacterium]